jgi:hypothetical protein
MKKYLTLFEYENHGKNMTGSRVSVGSGVVRFGIDVAECL